MPSFSAINRHFLTGVFLHFIIDADIEFPRVFESDEVTGFVTKEAGELTGLPVNLPICGGGGDAVIQTTGMGIVKEGTVGLIIGTSGVVSVPLKSCNINSQGRLQYFCNNDKALWQAFGCQLSSGGSLEWFKNAFYKDTKDAYRTINEEAETVNADAGRLLFFPYLTGERCPYVDSNARGVFFGLSLLHGRAEMTRSIMEGVTFGLKQIFELIKDAAPDLSPKEIISSGGASRSKAWRQIQADIFDLPVKTLKGAAEGGAYGAALVAGVSGGIWSNISEAAEILKSQSITEPVQKNVQGYRQLFEVYDNMYDGFKKGFNTLNRIK